jgi:FMN-dependent NADH-azoreductase
MAHLLHIDSSIQGDRSVSRKLTARARDAWLAAHPGGTETKAPLLGGREFVVLASRGGGYAEGTPRHGWDHAEPWLPHAISLTGLEPRFITAELTLAHTNPAMAELIPLADQSLAEAEADIDGLWGPESAVA